MAHWGSHEVEEVLPLGGEVEGGGVVVVVVGGGGGGARVGEGVSLRLAASSAAAMSAAEGDAGAAGEGLASVWVGRPEREREFLLRRWAAAAAAGLEEGV